MDVIPPEPPGPPGNTLEVGSDGKGYVVVNHPDLVTDEHGNGHIVFTPEQARGFAKLLMSKALDADIERRAGSRAARAGKIRKKAAKAKTSKMDILW